MRIRNAIPFLFLHGFASLLNNKTDDHRGDDDQRNGNENNLLNPDISFLSPGQFLGFLSSHRITSDMIITFAGFKYSKGSVRLH
jgi:hypothetical protein